MSAWASRGWSSGPHAGALAPRAWVAAAVVFLHLVALFSLMKETSKRDRQDLPAINASSLRLVEVSLKAPMRMDAGQPATPHALLMPPSLPLPSSRPVAIPEVRIDESIGGRTDVVEVEVDSATSLSSPASLAAGSGLRNAEFSAASQSRTGSVSPQGAAAVADHPIATIPASHEQCRDLQAARHYPALLRERGVQGLVRLRVKVDENGRAAEVLIAGGSGFRLLDEAARRVAESCPYLPARREGQRVSSWIDYAVRFALQPAASPPL